MSDKPTKLLSDLEVDTALTQDSNYRFDEIDRQYIDTQILAIQTALINALIKGRHGTYFTLDPDSASVQPGDAVCLAGKSTGAVTKAVAAALTGAGSAAGVVINAAAPGGRVFVAFGGTIPPAITGLAISTPGFVRVNTTTGRVEQTATLVSSDCALGTVDTAGWTQLSLAVLVASSTGLPAPTYAKLTGFTGIASDPTYTPIVDGAITVNVGASGKVWLHAHASGLGDIGGGSATARMRVAVDDVTAPYAFSDYLGTFSAPYTGQSGVEMTLICIAEGLSPGPHTFLLVASYSGAQAWTIDGLGDRPRQTAWLMAIPL